MNVHVWLDAPLAVLGLLAMLPCLWIAFRRRRFVCPRSRNRVMPAAMVILFYLGLSSLLMAGVDVGLAAWEDAHRPRSAPFDFNSQCAPVAFHLLRPSHHASHGEAPDFCLTVLDEERSIRLSDFREHKPVVLIFGSFG